MIHVATGRLIAYGSAGCGWPIYLILPSVVGSNGRVVAEARIRMLGHRQRSLVELWGDQVVEGSDGTGTSAQMPPAESRR